jgi:hypothetical protein
MKWVTRTVFAWFESQPSHREARVLLTENTTFLPAETKL